MTGADSAAAGDTDSAAAGDTGALPASPAAQPEARRGSVVDWFLVALICLLAAWVAVVGIAFLPFYLGSVPLPISALLGVAAMILAPRACYGLTGSAVAAALPVAAWFGVSVCLVLAHNSLMPELPVTVYQQQWRVTVLLGLGALAAAATLGLIWGDRLKARITAGNRL